MVEETENDYPVTLYFHHKTLYMQNKSDANFKKLGLAKDLLRINNEEKGCTVTC